MIHLGIDVHKRYSYVTALDDRGQVKLEAKVTNHRESFEKITKGFGEECEAVIEAGYTWGAMYDLLEGVGIKTQVAHPYKLRTIAESQIKTDQRDSRTLADLQKAGLIPAIYVPPKDVRELKNVLRQRMFLVRLRTMVKNRIHQLLDRNHVENPGFTDLFGRAGRNFIDQVELKGSEQELLESQLDLLDHLLEQIKDIEKMIKDLLGDDWRVKLLMSHPGIGITLATVIALEIDDIRRFRNSRKFTSYAGLVPSLHASGGYISHGPLVKSSNHYLKWAFVEAAWKAQTTSPYCRAYFQRIRKHKGANVAIVALARRIAEIVFKILTEKRPYKEIGIICQN